MMSRIAYYIIVVVLLGSNLVHARNWQVLNVTCGGDYSNKSDCSSLENVVGEVKENTSVQIDIKVPRLQLNVTLNLTNLVSLIINGEPGTSIICESNNIGIVLRDIMDTVSIRNLNLISCGTKVNHVNDTYRSALTMIHCKSVDLDNVVVSKSRGVGLAFFHHRGGRVYIQSSIFKENKLTVESEDDRTLMGGGGVLISIETSVIENLTFHFNACSFEDNMAHTYYYKSLYTDAMDEQQGGYGLGGGIQVLLRNSFDDINVIFSVSFLDCEFKHNQAFLGSGLAFVILDKTLANIRLEVIDSNFLENGCKNPNGLGGGAYLTLHAHPDESIIYYDIQYDIILTGVNFTSNCAEYGGGVYYNSSKQILTNSMLFDGCIFKGNVAHVGSAIIVSPTNSFTMSTGNLVIPVFQYCQFLENKVQDHNGTSGVGTVYVSEFHISFKGYNSFENNSGSSIYIVNGILDLRNSDVSFVSNTAFQGGAVALIGLSVIIVGPHSYNFTDNSALYQGGAIYILLVDKLSFTISNRCFVQYREDENGTHQNAVMYFDGNRVSYSTVGSAIYATSLNPCRIRDGTKNGEYTFVNVSLIIGEKNYNVITSKDNTAEQEFHIATDPVILYDGREHSSMMEIPGKMYELNVIATDDLKNTFNATVKVAAVKGEGVKLYSKIQLSGNPNSEAEITLHTVSPRTNFIQLNVTLGECPPGYKIEKDITGEKNECRCNVEEYVGLFKCNEYHSYLLPGYWAGAINDPKRNENILSTSAFPFYNPYPDNSSKEKLPLILLPDTMSPEDLTKAVCSKNRTGIACGKCRVNFTVHFNSPNLLCKLAEPAGCNIGWLFYILSELVPVTMLFVTISLLGISFTSGAVNGLILFSQLLVSLDIDASGVTFSEKYQINKGFQVAYGIFNMEFFYFEGLSFCIWKNASALDMLAMKYVTVLYTILLIVVVIWTMNKCGGRCFGNCCRITTIKSSATHGLSTFFILCYQQCIKTSLSMIIPLYLNIDEKSTSFKPPRRVWFNGELVYFSKEHLPYFITALFCLFMIGLLPPIVLLSYPLFNKVLATLGLQNIKLVVFVSQKIPITSLKPLLDSFQGCFKDNLRFFAGLYFLYRWIILLVYIFIKDFSNYYHAINGTILVVLMLHTICQPYTKRIHNIIDTLLFINLLLINSLSSFNYHNITSYSAKFRDIKSASIAQQVLIYLPLIVFATYVTIGYVLKTKFATELVIPKMAKKLKKFVLSITSQNEMSSSSDEVELIYDRLVDEEVECHEYHKLEDMKQAT